MPVSELISVEKVVIELLSVMSPEQIIYLKQLKQMALRDEHFGFSLWVRNQIINMPIQPSGTEVYEMVHLDEISSQLTEMLWQKLQTDSDVE
jgi:hypothetical protein